MFEVQSDLNMIEDFLKIGYLLQSETKFKCPDCEAQGEAILQTAGITGNYIHLPWVNYYTALLFTSKNGKNHVFACRCGWRSPIT